MTPKKKTARPSSSAPLLDVYHGDALVGHLGQDGTDAWFQYTEPVVAATGAARYQLSVRLPVKSEAYGNEATLVFFDNLLLETDTRGVLARMTQHDQRDVAGLLGEVGSECAGAVSLWPHDVRPPDPPRYRSYTPAELAVLFDAAHGEQLTKAQLESRQSLSGVQDKLVFRRGPGTYDLPLEGAPGDVILKRPSQRYPGLVENEFACQQLVAALGLGAAPTAALTAGLYLLESTRYDRLRAADGMLRRIHQEDFCQATGRLPRHKYQRQSGPGYGDLARMLRRVSVTPAADLARLLRLAVLNLCVGNMDAHSKNFAILYHEDGPTLAPCYDVVSTLLYPSLAPTYAMYVGPAERREQLGPQAFTRFARDLGVTRGAVEEAVGEVTETLPQVWPTVRDDAIAVTGDAPIYDQLETILMTERERVQRAIVKSAG
jgi:serine/threonine-protein kinase HipA